MVSSVNSSGTANAASTSGLSNQTLAQNFTTFLQLLTTQLKNQNPLDPLDTNQFTQQLVQFASVEQQMKTNDTLSSLVSLADANRMAAATGMIGKAVTSDGASSQFVNGQAQWTITADEAAPQTRMTIKDAQGNEVYSQSAALGAGSMRFVWDGVTSTGATAPDGFYTLTVTARDANGKSVLATTELSGVVDGVVFADGSPILTMGSERVPLSSVKSILAR